jgi:integrase
MPAMKTQALRPQQLDAARATDKNPATGKPVTQLTDGAGLYLKLSWVEGGKRNPKGHGWRFDYTRPTTKARNTMVIGSYPAMTLAEARTKAAELRAMVSKGIDPMQQRADETALVVAAQQEQTETARRAALALAPAGTLLGVAQDYHAGKVAKKDWAAGHAAQWIGMVTRCLPSSLALLPIADVKAVALYEQAIEPLELAGKIATARTLRKFLAEVFTYAELRELRTGNPATVSKSLMVKHVEHRLGNNAAITNPDDLRALLARIATWANVVTRAALQVQVALFQRPNTTCTMKWADVDLDAALWTITPEVRTKLHKSLRGAAHVIALPTQVVAVLRELQPLTGHSEWVFLSDATGRAITNDTLTNALRTMGFGGQQTAHGFRATARTMIVKHLRFEKDWVEAQLAHTTSEEMGTAYDRNKWAEERGPMLQAWADYLDGLLAVPALAAVPLKLAA